MNPGSVANKSRKLLASTALMLKETLPNLRPLDAELLEITVASESRVIGSGPFSPANMVVPA